LNEEVSDGLNEELPQVELGTLGVESGTIEGEKGLNAELSKLNRELIGSPNRPSLPPLKPTALPTLPQGSAGADGAAAKLSGQDKEMLSVMSEEYAKVRSGYLNTRAGKNRLLTLAEEHGESVVVERWRLWLGTRNLDGLECPLIKFADEFSYIQIIADNRTANAQAEQDRRDGRTRGTREVEESQRRLKIWRDGLERTDDIDQFVRTILSHRSTATQTTSWNCWGVTKRN
jgi:hypothetical protein